VGPWQATSSLFATSLADAATRLVSLNAFSFEEITKVRFEMETTLPTRGELATAHMKAMESALATSCDLIMSDEESCAAGAQFHRAVVDTTANGPLCFGTRDRKASRLR
jgi:hypothetical protein